MNNELKKSLEMRQENLIFLLKNKKDQLELEKQHQLYGAIKEIDYILRMMSVTEEEDVEQERSLDQQQTNRQQQYAQAQRAAPAEKKSFKVPIKIKFQRT